MRALDGSKGMLENGGSENLLQAGWQGDDQVRELVKTCGALSRRDNFTRDEDVKLRDLYAEGVFHVKH